MSLSHIREHGIAVEPVKLEDHGSNSAVYELGDCAHITSPLLSLGFLIYKMGIVFLPYLLPQTVTRSNEVMFLKMWLTVKAHTHGAPGWGSK